MAAPRSAAEVLRRHLADPASAFSIGAMGAIAEFMRDPDEALTGGDPAALVVATPRGAIALEGIEAAVPVAYETLSRNPERWGQGIVFCLPEGVGPREEPRAGRTSLTELGPDRAAVLPAGRDLILFDLGVGAANLDFCIRTDDPELLAFLRAREGRPLFAGNGDGSLAAIASVDPQRVVISGLGRIEVTQAVGRTRTPEGPHSHLLPDLLAAGRSHGTETPVPAGHLPALHLYPPHPSLDMMGRARPFDPDRHAAFQDLLAAWAPPGYAEEKARFAATFDAGGAAEGYTPADSALGRLALRVALRQSRRIDGESRRLAGWRARFDPVEQGG